MPNRLELVTSVMMPISRYYYSIMRAYPKPCSLWWFSFERPEITSSSLLKGNRAVSNHAIRLAEEPTLSKKHQRADRRVSQRPVAALLAAQSSEEATLRSHRTTGKAFGTPKPKAHKVFCTMIT
jgi:hypothetical protein